MKSETNNKHLFWYIAIQLPLLLIMKLCFHLKEKLLDWVHHNYAVAYCLLRGVVFNPSRVIFKGNSILIFHPLSRVELGDDFVCNTGGIDNSVSSKIVVEKGATLLIGASSGISNTVIHCQQEIIIGSHVNIGAGCMIFDTNFHSTHWRDRLDRALDIAQRKKSPVKIGDLVFIGARSIVCKGVTIGEKAIVAAGSVVVCNIPPGEIWGGNPARFIKKASA